MTASAASCGISVPRFAPVSVTVYGPAPEPETAVTDQPVAVPPIVKSLAASPVTTSSKLIAYVVPPALLAE